MTIALPTWGEALSVIIAAAAIYALLISWSRLIGPRSFSQMTAFDIGVTVALGAIVGGTATGATPLWGGALGLSVLFAIRGVVARLRRLGLDRIVDNRPILVMARERILDDRLLDAQITRDDLLEALRGAGITRVSQVLAVVVERNGDLSVLREDEHFDQVLFSPVQGADELVR